jgi:hypothetical protein
MCSPQDGDVRRRGDDDARDLAEAKPVDAGLWASLRTPVARRGGDALRESGGTPR